MLQSCKSTYSRKLRLKVVKEWYTYDIHENRATALPLHPLSIYVQNSSTFFILDVQDQTNPPCQIITNQLKENMLPGPISKSAFVFNINSLILLGFPLASFHLAEASLSAFVWFYTRACSCPNITNCLLLIIVYIFSTRLTINLFHLKK